jgi:hypothetical protein
MNTNITKLLRLASGVALGLSFMTTAVSAQPANSSIKSADSPKEMTKAEAKKSAKTDIVPTSQSVGEDTGNFTITSSFEFGYRGQRVDGDINKFKSDLNYKAGPRLFDSTFLMKSKNDGKGELFDTFLITSTGWGADPSGNMRVSVEKPDLYRFEGTYRRFKYYRFLNSIANPNWLFSPIAVPPNPVTGLHRYDTYTQMGDFDLTFFPKNETIRFNVGYSPERYRGPFFTNYHNGGNEFWLLANARSRADDWRIGADGKVGPIDWTFLQGFRRFRDDTELPEGIGLNRNTATSVAQLTSFLRTEPTRGHVNYTRASVHSFIANRLDITGRIIYSKATTDSTYLERFTGTNFNFRVTGWPPTPPNAQPNTTNPSFYNISSKVDRPNTVGDIGLTYLVTDKFRLSNTFRVEDFTIDGIGSFSDFFSITRPITGGTRTDTFSVNNAASFHTIKYRKYSNTFEGDYQFNPRYSVHFGYRYGNRHEEQTLSGANFGNNGAPALTPEFEELTNHTHAFFGGFKARPSKNLVIYFDAEHGTADNVFTRIGNYDYTNIRVKSRWAPNRHWNVNLAFISRDNANPSEINGVSLSDFTAEFKSRVFTSSVDWMPNGRFTISGGYNYNWLNSEAIIDYYYQLPPAASVRHPNGQALYYQRLNYFFFDVTSRINRRMTLYTSYRLNDDNGQGNRLADPAGNPGTLITSYPMSFNNADARLAIMINRYLDWNLGYTYYSYNESDFLRTFPGSPRAQNYHAHLPYMSLRLYIGRRE